MPELPEVETVCRSLRPHLLGRTITRVKVLEPRLRVTVDRRALCSLAGKRVEDITRTAKYILLRQKHDHIIVELDNGTELRYHDPRRFGLSLVTKRDELLCLPQLCRVGIDPFDQRLTGDYLFGFTRGSERRIRDLLLDQQIIAGLGNIYANEILALAGVKPTARAHRLTRRQVQGIAETIPALLGDAIRWCGTSFSNYRDADDKSGEFQNHLRVYDRDGERCRVCPSTIKRVAIGNRSAFYCPTCQK